MNSQDHYGNAGTPGPPILKGEAAVGSASDLRNEAWERLEPILELFELALSRGERPALDAFLPALEPAERRVLLGELAHADLEYRLKAAEPARVEDYLTRYPELRSSADILLGLIGAEFRVRRQREPALSHSEFLTRFPEHQANLVRYLSMPAPTGLGKGGRAPIMAPPKPAGGGALPALARLGDFRIIREIGRGGMGVVYEALQVSLGRHVALKVLPQKFLMAAHTRQRFEREAKAAAKLHHTNIVPVFGVGEQDGMPYYVMQFIEGRGLDQVLEEVKKQQPGANKRVGESTVDIDQGDVSAAQVARSLLTGRFVLATDVHLAQDSDPAEPRLDRHLAPPAKLPASAGTASAVSVDREVPDATAPVAIPSAGQPSNKVSLPISPAAPAGTAPRSGSKPLTYWQGIARIGFQVADALEYSHKQGVLHRDIKPSNLLVDLGGTVWITDFGLAKADDQENLTQTGDILGTVRYMPPEAFEGSADARGDIYALGLTLYELVSLRPAFDERDRNRLIKQVTAEEPARLDRLVPSAPRDLVTIIHKAIERNPADRYPSAGALAADLRRFLADESILARRQTQLERYRRWARRNPGVAALGSVLATVLVVVTVASLLAAGYFNRAAQRERDARQEADQRGNAERWERYRSNIAVAAGALQLQNSGAARSALEAAPPEHRNWEWQYYHSQLDGASLVLRVPGGRVRSFVVSPSGKQVAVCCADHNEVYLYDVTNGKETAILRGHSAAATSVAYRPDGKQIATASNDQTIRLWDPETGRQIALLQAKGVRAQLERQPLVAYNADGTRLASYPFLDGGAGTSRLWDATADTEVAELAPWQASGPAFAFSPDGKRVAVGFEKRVQMCDAATGRLLFVLGPYTSLVANLAFSADGKRVAAYLGEHAGKIYLCDAENGTELAVLPNHSSRIGSVLFSPDGSRLISINQFPDNLARIWDSATGRPLVDLPGHKNNIVAVSFGKDGQRVVTGSFDQTARLWDVQTGQLVAILAGHTGLVKHVLVSPNGLLIVTASDDATLRLWDSQTGDLIGVLRGHGEGFPGQCPPRFTPDGSLLISGSADGTVRIWDMGLVQRNGILKGHTSYVYDVAFCPDNEQVASASWDGTARIWNATTGQRVGNPLPCKTGSILSVAFRQDGRRLVTGEADLGVTLWDVAARKPERHVPDGPWGLGHLARATLNPAGTLLAAIGADDGLVRLWDAATGAEVARFEGHDKASLDLALSFDPDGAMLASAGENGAILIWEVAARRLSAVLRGHTNIVSGLSFSPDRRQLASGSIDKTIRFWDAKTYEPLGSIPLGSIVYSVAFSPDGTRLAAGCRDNTIRLIDVAHRQQVAEFRGHTDYVHGVAWSPDGTRIVSGSGDTTVRIWDMLSAQERAKKANGESGR
jgi:eukaryotic-like serine/threonine-protein kinase